MLEDFGESANGGSGFRCPGMDCSYFAMAAGNTWLEQAEEACTNCKKCNGNFPIDPNEVVETATDEIDEIVSAVEEITNERKSSFYFEIDPLLFELVLFWERTERDLERNQRLEMVAVLKFQNEILKAGLGVKTK